MRKNHFLILAIMVGGIGMIIRTFFGGGNIDTENVNSGIVSQLNNDGEEKSYNESIQQTNQGNENNTNITTNTETPTEILEIRVMMPKYFYNSGWKNFAQDLYTQKNIYIKFTFIDNLNTYRNFVHDNNFSLSDIILIPYDWVENVSIREFSFQQNLESEFDQLISPIVKSEKISFLPFAADPAIMYTSTGYTSPSNFSEIFDFISSRNPKKPLYFPIFFGITSEDFYNEGFIREYQDIIRYILLHYFTTYRDSNSLGKRIDSNVFEHYNIKDLNTIQNAITTESCKDFPSICFQLYNFVAIRFGFLSDADVVKQYFNNKKSEFKKITNDPLPFSSIETPVRIRGWSIPNSLQNAKTINGVYTFLVYYMNNHNKYNLRNSTLSVFSTDEKLIDNEFIGVRGYMLQTGGNYLKNLINSRAFRQLIGYQISAQDYLKKI